MSFFRSRFAPGGLYLLDEPETALSPKTQLELLELLGGCPGDERTQFIIATHSPILLSCPAAPITSCDHAPIRCVACQDTEQCRTCREFLREQSGHVEVVLVTFDPSRVGCGALRDPDAPPSACDGAWKKPSDAELRKVLSVLQYEVTQRDAAADTSAVAAGVLSCR